MAFPSGGIYYGTGNASADVSTGAEGNNTLESTSPGASTLAASIAGGQSGTFWTFTTAGSNPNLTTWVAGSYIAQVNISALGADVTWGIEIHRINSSGASIETLASVANTTYNTAAVNTLTWNNATDKSVSAGDRLQVRVTGVRAASHGNQSCDVNVGTGNDATTTKLNVPVVASTRRVFIVS